MNGYLLRGVNDELLLVFRSYSQEDILAIIRKVGQLRDKEIKSLAEDLEGELYDRSANQ